MRLRYAFSMIELIFVIVIMGIIGKFGTEFLAQSYDSFIFSKVNNTLQSQSTKALELITARLQYRIKDSIIARDPNDNDNSTNYVSLSQADENHTIIEWVQIDEEGFRGTVNPYWSSVIDIDNNESNEKQLVSPQTNTTAINELIKQLSADSSSIDDAAIYFIGANSDKDGYGWGGVIENQEKAMHPIKDSSSDIAYIVPRKGGSTDENNFTGTDIYEYYQLSWNANALVLEDNNLTLYYNYQPWDGDTYSDGSASIIMQNVSTFRIMALGSVLKIQVCVKSKLVEEYALCKEKTIF